MIPAESTRKSKREIQRNKIIRDFHYSMLTKENRKGTKGRKMKIHFVILHRNRVEDKAHRKYLDEKQIKKE